MSRRNEIQDIAKGLVGSFNSRNNDIDGYWAIGKLQKFLEYKPSKNISIEVISGEVSPETDEFDSLIKFYRERLTVHMASRKVPEEYISLVEFSVEFEAEYQEKYHLWRSGLGKPYVIKCEITDYKGKHYTEHAYGNSRPHDPNRETRSSRAAHF